MTDDADGFDALVRDVRSGDSGAITEFVRRYEPLIRMKLRTWIRLRYPEMRRLYNSVDICQSILKCAPGIGPTWDHRYDMATGTA
jgi:hypothetical protein